MKVGDEVKWAQPINHEESTERFVLIELNGDRCFIQFICNLPIPPVQVAKASDLVLANSKVERDYTLQ